MNLHPPLTKNRKEKKNRAEAMFQLRTRHARNKLVVGRKKANTRLTRQKHSAACHQHHCKTSAHESTNKGAWLPARRGRDLSLAELVDQYRVPTSLRRSGPIRQLGRSREPDRGRFRAKGGVEAACKASDFELIINTE